MAIHILKKTKQQQQQNSQIWDNWGKQATQEL